MLALLMCGTANSATIKPEEKKPTIEDWIGKKLTTVAAGCIGTDNIKALAKQGPIIPRSLTDWSMFSTHMADADDKVHEGSAGKFMSQVIDTSVATPVILDSALSGAAYPPLAVAENGYYFTHVQNCMTMLAGKGNLKLSAVILQAALDATYDGSNTQALVLDGGTITSAYGWALEDMSGAKFTGIERTEVMLDIWAWYRSNPSYAASDKLRIYDTMSGIEAHLVKDITVASLLKGSVSSTGGVPFFTGGGDGNGNAKVLTSSKGEGFETAVFSSHDTPLPTAAALAARLEPKLHLIMDQANQVWFTGAPVKITARLARTPQSACENAWTAENGKLDNIAWDAETHACRFDVTFSPAKTTADTVTLALYLKSTVGSPGGAAIRVGQDVVLSNEAAKISFAGVTHSLGALPSLDSAIAMPLTLSYRVAERQGRVLDTVAANDQLTFKCGEDAETRILVRDAHIASGTGTKDVMVSVDVPASAIRSVAQTATRCAVGGMITVGSTGTGGNLLQDKTLPIFNFDLVRPAPAQQGAPPSNAPTPT